MTIPRVKPGDWSLGEKLTSAQQNELDTNVTYALDKRNGETDTLESVVSLTGPGRIVPKLALGTDADTTYQVDAANNVIRLDSTITANRVYTLSNTNAVSGDEITIYCEPTLLFEVTVEDAATSDLYVVGNLSSSDGQWACFIFAGGAWRLFRGGQGSRTRSNTFTASGSWVCPAGVFLVHLFGFGGGGGGGAGYTHGVSIVDIWNCGGAGGGGALASYTPLAVTPGTTYAVTIGTGGVGGASGGAPGADGGDSDFDTLVYFPGGQGGGSSGNSAISTNIGYTYGGHPVRYSIRPSTFVLIGTSANFFAQMPLSSGGYGRTNNSFGSAVFSGGPNPHGGAGGGSGLSGSDSGSYRGGGGGGGGGGGPFAAGGVGAPGTNGNNAGVTAAGGNGANGGLGAGGGGAGASGHGSGGQGGTGIGGSGGDGQIIVMWTK